MTVDEQQMGERVNMNEQKPTITQQELDRCVAEQQQKYRALFEIHSNLSKDHTALIEQRDQMQKALTQLHGICNRALDAYEGSLPDRERGFEHSDTRNREMNIEDWRKEIDSVHAAALALGNTK